MPSTRSGRPRTCPRERPGPYDHPSFILLNVAGGGTWPGAPVASTVFPQTMKVDYVLVYARS